MIVAVLKHWKTRLLWLSVLLLAGASCYALLCAQAAAQAGGQHYAAGAAPHAVVAGHFDGYDNGADLAVSNYNEGTVSVLLNKGDGAFQNAVNYQAGKGPMALAVGDFTGLGRRDLIVALSGQDAVAVLLNNGNGTFAGARTYAVAPAPASAAVGDFNRDGRQDAVVAGLSASVLSILLANEDGGFATVKNFEVGYVPFFVTTGDVNNDGKLDLVTSPWARQGVTQLGVHLGKGDGTFGAAARFYGGQNSYQVAIGDFNSDGKADLLTANNLGRGAHLLLGNGDGSFQNAVNFAVGDSGSVLTGDFDGDGRLDFAVTNSVEAKLVVMLGKGDGTFQAKQSFAVARGPVWAAVGDFDRDGKRDLATANQTANNVTVLLGKTLAFSSERKTVRWPEIAQ